MVKRTFLFVVLSVGFFKSFAFNPDSLVNTANEYYVNNNFYQAIEIYKLVIDSGYTAPELYYNLGNSYYKTNNYALAILNYERALILDPSGKDIRFNLELANAHVVDKIEVIPEFFLYRWVKSLINITTSNKWAIISIVTFILFLILFLIYLFSGKMGIKKISFYSFILVFFLSLTSLIFSIQRKKIVLEEEKAIIIAPSVTAKSSPNEYGTNLFILHEGTKVEVVDSIGQWIEIKLSNGSKGWMQKDNMVKI